MQKTITNVFSVLTDLIFPRRCPICEGILRADEKWICQTCRVTLSWIREPLCKVCGKPLADEHGDMCADCRISHHVFVQGRSVFLYEGKLRLSVTRMKFHNKREYLDFYAQVMAAYAQHLPAVYRNRCIVPIPMHPKKRRQRGYDQCALLAEKFSRAVNMPVDLHLLRRIRYTKAQKGLDYEQRHENVNGAFMLQRCENLPERVLLLDDIYTTGTTMDAAASALKAAGISDILCFTLCIVRGREEKRTGKVYDQKGK